MIVKYSIAGSCSNPRRVAHRHYSHSRAGCPENVKTQGDRQEAALSRGARFGVGHLLGQDWYAGVPGWTLYVADARSLGTLTKNEQTVTEVYSVDETITLDHHSPVAPSVHVSPSLHKTLAIGALCNNAVKNEEGEYVGQSTDVALLNVLPLFGLADQRQARQTHSASLEVTNSSSAGLHAAIRIAVQLRTEVHGGQRRARCLVPFLERRGCERCGPRDVLHQGIHRRHPRSLQVLLRLGRLHPSTRREHSQRCPHQSTNDRVARPACNRCCIRLRRCGDPGLQRTAVPCR